MVFIKWKLLLAKERGKTMTVEFEDFKKRRVEGAIIAFIRGKKDTNWVMGIIKSKWGVIR